MVKSENMDIPYYINNVRFLPFEIKIAKRNTSKEISDIRYRNKYLSLRIEKKI